MTINLPDDLFDVYHETMDLFMTNDNFSRPATLMYPPRTVDCNNCTTQWFAGVSKNVYAHGGPAPFTGGKCPVCGGNSKKQVVDTDSVRLRTIWTKKDWIKLAGINVPDAEAQIIGYASDLKNIKKAQKIKLMNHQKNVEFVFALSGEPFMHGFGRQKYFIAFVKRA